MASETLKPCPMCGRDDSENNAIQQAAVNVRSVKSAIGGRAYQVECVCGTRGPVMAGAEEAVMAWNPRAAVAELVEAIEKLESACDAVAAKRTQATYLSMLDNDRAHDELLALDEARYEARHLLSRHQENSNG